MFDGESPYSHCISKHTVREMMIYDYNHPAYREARRLAMSRSDGWCQFCGLTKAEEAHHWRGYKAGHYKTEAETTSDDLIALCRGCHKIATTIREGYKRARTNKLIEYENLLRKQDKELKEKQERLRRIEKELIQREEYIEEEIESEIEERKSEEWEEIEEIKRELGIDFNSIISR